MSARIDKRLTNEERAALQSYQFRLPVGEDRCATCAQLVTADGQEGGGHECQRLGHVIAEPAFSRCSLFEAPQDALRRVAVPRCSTTGAYQVKRVPASVDEAAGVGDGDEQGTPTWLLQLLRLEFDFTHDLFASHLNAVALRYFTRDNPAGEQMIGEHARGGWTCFANPPYSRRELPNLANGKPGNDGANILDAMHVCARVAEWSTVVTLTRLEPGAEWFRVIRDNASEIRLLDCRLRFRGQPNLYNFPTCVAVWRPHYTREPGPARVRWWDAQAISAYIDELREVPEVLRGG